MSQHSCLYRPRMVAGYAQQLVRYLYPPIPCLARALSALILRQFWIMGLWCFLSTTLAAVCMAKEEPSPFHCTQGTLPHCTCMSSMGHQWAGTYVLYHCDNVAAVWQVNCLLAQDSIAAHLLHCSWYCPWHCSISAFGQFTLPDA